MKTILETISSFKERCESNADIQAFVTEIKAKQAAKQELTADLVKSITDQIKANSIVTNTVEKGNLNVLNKVKHKLDMTNNVTP